MSERGARAALALLVAGLLVVAAIADLPELSDGGFWSDGATYTTMALSLAEDFDLRYEARDVLRVRREFAQGPQGIFLKRSFGGFTTDGVSGFPWLRRVEQTEGRVYFAKASVYPLAAAPLVKAFGTKGLLLTNALWLGLALVLAYLELRRLASPASSLALTLAVFLGGITPLYLLWPQPEVFNVGVIMAGLSAWRRGWPLVSAVLFGVAVYSKPTNVFLALPLGVAPLLVTTLPALGRGFLESLRRGAVLAAVALSFYGLNVLVTGEWNYQGGERKTFVVPQYGRAFPFEAHGVTFGNSGFWMTTNRLGPTAVGQEQELSKGEVALAAEELRGAFLKNLGYFWFGRYGGALPYFPPIVLAVAAFLLVGPRAREGWLALASLAASWLFYIWLIPANWYGGGGTVGNRYFLNLVPLGVYLVPRGRELLVAGLGAILAAWSVGPALLQPVVHSLHPGWIAKRAPLTFLPAELTMLNDLSFNTEAWRKKQSIGDTEGDPWRGWPPDPKAFWLYFPDDGTWGKELHLGREGFWLRGGARAEVLLRANEPVQRIAVTLHGAAGADEVAVSVGGRRRRLSVAAGETAQASFETEPGFLFYDSFVHRLELRSARGTLDPRDGRSRGAFVELAIQVERRQR